MLRKELNETKVLIRSVPSVIVALYAISVIMMNLLANKSINLPVSWLALDCGIIVSWMAFLTMDIVTKHFGAKASIKISFLVTGINLIVCAIFAIAKIIPGMWGESFSGDAIMINAALDNTFGGTWYVLFGSTVACLVSSVVNSLLNEFIGKVTKHKNEFVNFSIRSYISTAIGQFVDNMVFALIVSINFFGWTMLQCVMCSATGAIVELLFEVVFSPVGYKISKQWEAENVGKEYLDLVA